MTSLVDLDRQLGAWFEERATPSAPDGLLTRSMTRVAATRQRPGWLVRDGLARRTSRAPSAAWRAPQLLAAVTALVVVATVGVVLTRPNGFAQPVPTSSPTPIATSAPSPSATATAVPSALRATWIGATREVPQITPPLTQSVFSLTESRLEYLGGTDPILVSNAALVSPGTLAFGKQQDGSGCRSGDLGTYTFSLNPSGRVLTLAVVSDPCVARIGALTGTWSRVDCPASPGMVCLGELDPGVHETAAFNPFLSVNAWRYQYGRVSYTVPAGWSNTVDGSTGYMLVPTGTTNTGIFLFQTALPDSQADGCPGTVEPGVGQGAPALGRWVSKLPGLTTTAPTAVTVGGLRGVTLDVSVKPTWTRPCPYSSGKPYVPMFTNGDSGNNFDWGLTVGGHMRLYLLDLPDGRTTLIDVEAPDAATWDALVVEAAPVIASFSFHP